MRVRHLVLPMGGLGKRLRPLTLRKPKGLVELQGAPLVEYLLDEARNTGIKEVVFVISPRHQTHFEKYVEKNKERFPWFTIHLRVQKDPLGNGHAVFQAADVIGNRPFAVRFSDDLLFHNPPVFASLMNIFEREKAPVILLERVPKEKVSRYGVVGVKPVKKPAEKGNLYRITSIVEKPAIEVAPSNLTVVGGYILTPAVLYNLRKIIDSLPAAGHDALPLAVALQVELMVRGKLYGWEFPGSRLDCGTLEGFKQAEEFVENLKK